MLTRKQALLTLALMTSLPLASWAATEAATNPTPNTVQPCPMYDQDGDGYGPGMMHQGRFLRDHDNMRHGMMGGGYGMRFNNPEDMQKALDEIKDPQVKAKYIDMLKARLAFEESQLQSTKTFLDKQK